MSEYILIIWLTFYSGGGPTTAVFSSKAKCEIAAAEVLAAVKYRTDRYSPTNYGGFVCVPK